MCQPQAESPVAGISDQTIAMLESQIIKPTLPGMASARKSIAAAKRAGNYTRAAELALAAAQEARLAHASDEATALIEEAMRLATNEKIRWKRPYAMDFSVMRCC